MLRCTVQACRSHLLVGSCTSCFMNISKTHTQVNMNMYWLLAGIPFHANVHGATAWRCKEKLPATDFFKKYSSHVHSLPTLLPPSLGILSETWWDWDCAAETQLQKSLSSFQRCLWLLQGEKSSCLHHGIYSLNSHTERAYWKTGCWYYFFYLTVKISFKRKSQFYSLSFFPDSPLMQYNLHTAARVMSVSKTWGRCGGGQCYIKSHRNLQKQCGLSYEENSTVNIFQ